MSDTATTTLGSVSGVIGLTPDQAPKIGEAGFAEYHAAQHGDEAITGIPTREEKSAVRNRAKKRWLGDEMYFRGFTYERLVALEAKVDQVLEILTAPKGK